METNQIIYKDLSPVIQNVGAYNYFIVYFSLSFAIFYNV